jgi:hypothetical protein
MNKCVGIIATLITMNREEADSDIKRVEKAGYRRRFWVPEPLVAPMTERKLVRERAFRLAAGNPSVWDNTTIETDAAMPVNLVWSPSWSLPQWHESDAWDGHVALLREQDRFILRQRHFDYFFYP